MSDEMIEDMADVLIRAYHGDKAGLSIKAVPLWKAVAAEVIRQMEHARRHQKLEARRDPHDPADFFWVGDPLALAPPEWKP